MKAISLRLDEQTLQDIKKVSSIYNIPTSDLIRKGIKMILEAKKSETYYRLTADIEETTYKNCTSNFVSKILGTDQKLIYSCPFIIFFKILISINSIK